MDGSWYHNDPHCFYSLVSAHYCHATWKDLNIAMNHIEYSLISSPFVYNRVRKIAPFAIMVVIFMVLINFKVEKINLNIC